MATPLKQIFSNNALRKKILITIGLILVYKLVSHIPVPGANLDFLKSIFDQAGGGSLGALSALTGGGFDNFSIVLMGLSPYINASIIIQLLGVIIPKLEAIRKDGKRGYEQINKYTRWLTLPLAFVQSYGMIVLLNAMSGNVGGSVVEPSMILPAMITTTAGTLFLMWLGEVITEKGIGNGVSLIIFSSIVTNVPQYIFQQIGVLQEDSSEIYSLGLVLLVTVILLIFVVWFTEAERRVPVTYAEHGDRGMEKSMLPIRLNQAGMVPIIFGVSMVTFPSIIANLVTRFSTNPTMLSIAGWVQANFNPSSPTFWYGAIYFLFIIFFSYFYVSITFQPEKLAEDIQKRGGFIPGVRPGKETEHFLAKVSGHLTLWGGLFIGLVAVLPYLLNFFSLQAGISGNIKLLITGAGTIIIVGVVIELMKKIKTEMVMKDYDKFY